MKLHIGILLAVLSTAYAQQLNICQGVPDNTFIPNVSQCNGWFRCTPNGPVPGTCPSPWLFNPETLECDWEANVRCFTCPLTEPIWSMPVPGSCVQFIRCINGHATQEVCQSGLHFNNATQQCDLPANARCEITFTCPSNIPPGQMVSFRSDTNCSTFFVCTGSPTPLEQHCNPALHFDPRTQQCTFPEQTDCQLAPPEGTTQNPGDPVTGNPPFTCPSDGHFPHPNTCSSFIICAAGTPNFMNCSPGLYFNRQTNLCDFPSNANCTI